MGYFQVRYDSRVVNYDRSGFIRLATGCCLIMHFITDVVFQLIITSVKRRHSRTVLISSWHSFGPATKGQGPGD